MALRFCGLMLTTFFLVAGNHGAADPAVHAQVGGTAVLRFNFAPFNLENQTLDSRRIDINFTDPNKYVFSLRGGEENFEPQSESYKDRVSLNSTCLRHGLVVLTIHRVNLSDSGEYLLTLPKLNMKLSLVLDVKEAETKKTDGNNTTTAEGTKDEDLKHYAWLAVIPVAAIIIIIIIAVALLKPRPWSPKDGEKGSSNGII
ncbi:hypothetical protein OJAV_G00011290 [Oryzias javanicus]|uniref:Immunoglobulin V-set domain-containing protein n=1 Tax=Oryzias javanicus TaxID=123683 RepID=A0A3S2PIG7_ORYJA|nr:hypothetical protein OJAV_G00011290 [Oryzias javanicus]